VLVLVLEAADQIGGGTGTEELTLPGFEHDVCWAIHPLGVASLLSIDRAGAVRCGSGCIGASR
jgi:phytoene dehydrogenase-like protein